MAVLVPYLLIKGIVSGFIFLIVWLIAKMDGTKLVNRKQQTKQAAMNKLHHRLLTQIQIEFLLKPHK